jgi:hypothetical protein
MNVHLEIRDVVDILRMLTGLERMRPPRCSARLLATALRDPDHQPTIAELTGLIKQLTGVIPRRAR